MSYQTSSQWNITDAASRRTRSVILESNTPVQRGVILNIFLTISFFCIVSGTLVGIGQLFSIAFTIFRTSSYSLQNPRTFIQIYEVVLSFSVLFIEMEWTETIRSFLLLQDWTGRGSVYVFIGLLAFDNPKDNPFNAFSNKMAFAIMSGGLVYILMASSFNVKFGDINIMEVYF